MDISDVELEKLNPKSKLVKSAKKKFGLTFDCREAGFILDDGDMLDFSGKNEGGTSKTRNYDHREICRAISHGDKGISGDKCLDFFEKQANALRFGFYGSWDKGHDINVSLNTPQHPTPKQLRGIERCCSTFKHDKNALLYDVYGERGERITSGEVEKIKCSSISKKLLSFLEKSREEELK